MHYVQRTTDAVLCDTEGISFLLGEIGVCITECNKCIEVADIIKPKDLRATISNQNNLGLSLWSTNSKIR